MKKILTIGAALILSVSLLCGLCGAADVNESGNNIIYIGNEEIPIDVASAETFDGVEYSGKTSFITTEDMLNSTFENEFRSVFKEGGRILILGSISEEDVREYFGMPEKDSVCKGKSNGTISNADDSIYDKYGEDVEIVNVAEFPLLGRMIYRSIEGTNITGVYVEDLNNAELVENTIDYCFSYDYFGLSGESSDSSGFSNSWSNVDVTTNAYGHTRAMMTTSISIDRNDGNPNSDGEYLFYVPYRVDVDPNSSYAIHNVSLDVSGKSSSKIYDYGPKNVSCDANASVSFQLPMAISVSFAPGEKVAINKTGGGLDSSNFTVEYQPKNFLNVDSYTDKTMQCEAHIEGYQTNGYFEAYGAFIIETYKTQQPTGGASAYIDPMILISSPNDFVSGN